VIDPHGYLVACLYVQLAIFLFLFTEEWLEDYHILFLLKQSSYH